jgi:Fusaric acid resistance protein-like
MGLGREEPSFVDARVTHSIRRNGFSFIARFVHMREAYRVAIATLAVMQSSVGATIMLSVERIIAAAVGASTGAIEADFLGSKSWCLRAGDRASRIGIKGIPIGEDGLSLSEHHVGDHYPDSACQSCMDRAGTPIHRSIGRSCCGSVIVARGCEPIAPRELFGLAIN